jgi:hypothetical protein
LIQTELVTLILFIFDYLVRLITVHAVPQRLIYWDGRRINEDHSVRPPSPLYLPSLFQPFFSVTVCYQL